MNTKATLYLDSKLYKTLKLRAVETGQSISGLMNEALQAQLAEDLEDITTIRSRLAKKETPLSYEAALKELQRSGGI
ncbi:MAG TPA: CopG family transcriptional regulator [Verrucomicrobiae bacterium]|nr:CopG family transcriptional regulator [Verrucomicrobiae bacterium]